MSFSAPKGSSDRGREHSYQEATSGSKRTLSDLMQVRAGVGKRVDLAEGPVQHAAERHEDLGAVHAQFRALLESNIRLRRRAARFSLA